MYERILLLDDGSPLARSAIAHTVAIAVPGGWGVLVLRVSRVAGEDPEQLTTESWGDRVRVGTNAAANGPQLEADPPLSEVTAALREAGVRAVGSLVVKDADVGAAIVEVARRLGCDVIVMSTHGLTGVRRAVLGSVADYVVRHSGVPVLLGR